MKNKCDWCGADTSYRGWLHIATCAELRKREAEFRRQADEFRKEKRKAHRKAEGFVE